MFEITVVCLFTHNLWVPLWSVFVQYFNMLSSNLVSYRHDIESYIHVSTMSFLCNLQYEITLTKIVYFSKNYYHT
jgi:hypothetical protein